MNDNYPRRRRRPRRAWRRPMRWPASDARSRSSRRWTARRRADPVGLRQAGAVRRMGLGCDRRHGHARRRQSAGRRQAQYDGQEIRRQARRFHAPRCRTAARSSAGATILTTGFTHFDSINKPEWGFGMFPDVVTTTQVEQMISSKQGVRCPSDGRKPKRVAILLCVGSRDRQIGREWCSKICCSVSSNLAMEIREELPDCHVYIYYMDIRTFGLLETKFYWQQPGGIQSQIHQGAHRRGDVERRAADRQGRGHAGQAADHHPLRHGGACRRHGPQCRQHAAGLDLRRQAGAATASSIAPTPMA